MFLNEKQVYPPTDAELVEAMARAIYCVDEEIQADCNEAHLGCYFAPFNQFATDETKAMVTEYRVSARAALRAYRERNGK